jgi:hypothetical protein
VKNDDEAEEVKGKQQPAEKDNEVEAEDVVEAYAKQQQLAVEEAKEQQAVDDGKHRQLCCDNVSLWCY